MRFANLTARPSCALPVLALSALAAGLSAQTTPLRLGKTIPGDLSGGQTHTYTIKLKANQYLRAVVTQVNPAMTIELSTPNGKKVVEVDTRNFSKPASIVWVAESKGQYHISVGIPGQTDGARDYKIKLQELRTAIVDDRKRVEAERLLVQGLGESRSYSYDQAISTYTSALALYREIQDREREGDTLQAMGSAHQGLSRDDKAIGYFEEALAISREIKDRRGEGNALTNLGRAYNNLSQNEKAIVYLVKALAIQREIDELLNESRTLDYLGFAYGDLSQNEKAIGYFQQALAVQRQIHDRLGEGGSLMNIGLAYRDLSELEKAIVYFEQTLVIFRDIKERRGEGAALGNLSTVYLYMGQYEKAIGYCEQALAVNRETKAHRAEGVDLGDLGQAYDALGQYEKAIGYYEQSLAIAREVKDRRGETGTLNNLGMAYDSLSQYEKAIGYYEQSLAIAREVKDRRGESGTLNNLGNTHLSLSQYEKAIGYFEQALAIFREVKYRLGEGADLNNLGLAYMFLHQNEKAIGYYEQALAVAREVKDRDGEGDALNNLGLAYMFLDQNEKAISYYEQALAISREVKDRQGEGKNLDNLGDAYRRLSQNEKAIGYYEQALAISREVKDRDTETLELDGLMDTRQASGKPRLAIFYGKQAVNTVQSMRSDIGDLTQEFQQSFLKGKEKPYHTLAELLIAQGRLAEAEQVLALLKEEEYFQYIRREPGEASSLNRRADLTPEEAEYEKRYREIGDRLMTIGAEHGELLAKKTLTQEQSQRLEKLEQDLVVGNQAFEHFLGDLTQHFSAKPELNAKVVDQLREEEGFMEDLRELPAGTVAVYTLAGEDKFHMILRTPDAQKAYEFPIKAADLNRKIFEFRQAVGDPKVDPRPLAHELYQILIAPMADDLRQANAQTLMWSLDGALRYVPLAALYDGKQYLIEQYRVSVMTLASNARLKDRPDSTWSAAGFGVTKKHEDSAALPDVAAELEGVAEILHGETKLDEQFTEASMRTTLVKHFPVVHIASHFRFQPGDQSKSYLLLGDGGHLSMTELKTLPNLFSGVQLLTLSACNTGVGDGAEVEGFGTLAQRQGAKAVVASLWPVADESTTLLMREFYRIRETKPALTKLGALREAQLELLHGMTSGSAVSPQRGLVHDPAGPTAPQDFRHPYFWAPFFLMGNWL